MQGNDFLSITRQDGIATIFLDRAPVNALSGAFRTQIFEALESLTHDNTILAIVITTQELPFSAGADIKEFSQGYLGKTFMDIYEVCNSSTKPIIAGIRHYALGGGLELAMLCHHRVALSPCKLGQPEIKLGLIPGGTGTQSLPRLVGVTKSCDMILTGKPISAQDALSYGLLDRVCSEELPAFCQSFAQELLDNPDYVATIALHQGFPQAPHPSFFHDERIRLQQQSYCFQAPEVALSCIKSSCEKSLQDGLAFEQSQFMQLINGPSSQAMRYQFMAEHLAREVPGVTKTTPTQTLHKIGVVGGGLMGSGIAMLCAAREYQVIIVERDHDAMIRCRKVIADYFHKAVVKGKFSESTAQKIQLKICFDTDIKVLSEVDLVIEAVFEELSVKKTVLQILDGICKPACIFASNTSGLDLNALAQVTNRPSQVLGLHFFSPAQVMRLLEVVRGKSTSDETLATGLALARHLKKIAVCVGVCPGFVGNRMVIRYFQQVEYLLLSGVPPHIIDKALEDFGFAMGPCKMADMSGLDISMRMMPGDTLAAFMVKNGRLGQKSHAGFYNYASGNYVPQPSDHAHDLISKYAKKRGVEVKEYTTHEIVDRCVFSLINEGVHILEEGVVSRASDIDLVYVHGYGFPAYRGGPMFYADSVGLAIVRDKIATFAKTQHKLWPHSSMLQAVIRSGGKLYQQKVNRF
ncbi:MAG: 3-hydroxyacyl-CoA dehydrogenase NAD-binding domain-containing protein [Pseudomonadota bacterium]|nr:3-hydroxyacyl-CoA dehydrogenase NAD-binding domain-containing protein [Pseudomonadota bacterium]